MLKLRSKKFCRGISFKLTGGTTSSSSSDHKKGSSSFSSSSSSSSSSSYTSDIKWEVRPGGMLVQKRQSIDDHDHSSFGELITLRVSTVSQLHDVSIEPTSTFGELKMVLEMVTKLEAKEQRVLYRGKEREDEEYLHMVGVRDRDKVVVMEDPAIKEEKMKKKHLRRLHGLSSSSSSSAAANHPAPTFRTIRV
ncbi:BAG family molecular chaperone regulator 4 [Linum grandiflorum]